MAYDISKLVTLGQLKSLALKVKSEDLALLGTSSDASSAITIYGARALADSKVASISAGSGIEVSTSSPASATAPSVGIKLSAKTGNSLSLETGSGEEGLYVNVPAVSVVKKQTANEGYIASYQVTVGGDAVGTDIDIPKDYLVKSAEIKTVTEADVPYSGAVVGDKYIDFVINTKDSDGYVKATGTYDGTSQYYSKSGNTYTPCDQTSWEAGVTDVSNYYLVDPGSHIYLPVNDLAHVYTAGNGIDISAQDAISVKIDTTNANGLATTSAGLKLDPVTATTYTYTKITTEDTKAASGTTYYQKNGNAYTEVTGLTVGTSVVTGYYTRAVDTAGTNGAMTAEQAAIVANLANINVANDAEVTEMFTDVWGA